MKITKQRIHLFTILAPGSPLTLGNIFRELGLGEQVSRGEYIRVHQFVRGFVKQGLINQKKEPRHGESTFFLTTKGKEVANTLLHAYEEKVRKILEWNPSIYKQRISPSPIPPVLALPPKKPSVIIPDEVSCPQCGAKKLGRDVQTLISSKQKVWCECGYNLTPLAWAAMEGR